MNIWSRLDAGKDARKTLRRWLREASDEELRGALPRILGRDPEIWGFAAQVKAELEAREEVRALEARRKSDSDSDSEGPP